MGGSDPKIVTAVRGRVLVDDSDDDIFDTKLGK